LSYSYALKSIPVLSLNLSYPPVITDDMQEVLCYTTPGYAT
jgi:hypothetical protein